jgi:hypothetical protein
MAGLERPDSTGSFMSSVARSPSDAQLDANCAAPGSPSKLSQELAARLALADGNPTQPQVCAQGRVTSARCLLLTRLDLRAWLLRSHASLMSAAASTSGQRVCHCWFTARDAAHACSCIAAAAKSL